MRFVGYKKKKFVKEQTLFFNNITNPTCIGVGGSFQYPDFFGVTKKDIPVFFMKFKVEFNGSFLKIRDIDFEDPENTGYYSGLYELSTESTTILLTSLLNKENKYLIKITEDGCYQALCSFIKIGSKILTCFATEEEIETP